MTRPLILLAVLAAATLAAPFALAQPGPAQPAAAGGGNPFDLNPVQQAQLDQVLKTWETESAKVLTFRCPFTRWEYNAAFGPAWNVALSVDEGDVSYQKPDKGSFRITKISRWAPQPVAPGAAPPQGPPKGKHVEDPHAIGEHWVCDGRSVYEFKHDQKELHVQPIPPNLQGKAIVDGPLPFLFGAEAEKLKARYWLTLKQPPPSPDVIQLVAAPKTRADAANYKGVELMLDKNRMLPVGMQVWAPDGSRSVYRFHLDQVSINAARDRLWANLFQSPRTPFGWKRVVEPTTRQAAAQGAAAR